MNPQAGDVWEHNQRKAALLLLERDERCDVYWRCLILTHPQGNLTGRVASYSVNNTHFTLLWRF